MVSPGDVSHGLSADGIRPLALDLDGHMGQSIFSLGFSDVGASFLDPALKLLHVGTGVGYGQAASTLQLTSGTGVNQEFLARSVLTWTGAMLLRYSTIHSQRIANHNAAMLLADLVAENVACTVNGATSISVTVPNHGYTAANVGQFMLVGGISLATAVPGRYAIASIPDANTINFTVAGWPATGSCTLTLFGHSYIRCLYSGTGNSTLNFDAQRRGWATGDTAATVNSAISAGHIIQVHNDGRNVYLADTLRASTVTPAVVVRANRLENIPDESLPLHLFIWTYNGTVAPASTTTWTIGSVSVESYGNLPVYVAGQRMQGAAAPAPVAVVGTSAVTATLGAGTATAGGVFLRGSAVANGTSIAKVESAATTNATVVKASAGVLYHLQLTNTGASACTVKLYNKATAPTVGTDVPVLKLVIPAGQSVVIPTSLGYTFATGIGYAITRNVADADTTAIGAGEVVGHFTFV